MASTKQAREKAVKWMLASSALEGLQPDQAFRDLLDQYIAGDVTLDEALEVTKARFKRDTPSNEQ